MGDSRKFGIKYHPYEDRLSSNGYYLPNSSLLFCISINILIILTSLIYITPNNTLYLQLYFVDNQTTKELFHASSELISYPIIELQKTTTVAFCVAKSLIARIAPEPRIDLQIGKSVRKITDTFYITYAVKLLFLKIL